MGIDITTDGPLLTVPGGPPIVIVPNALVFTDRGKEIGRIEARYDLSKMPPELRDMAVNFLQIRGYVCELGAFLHPPPPRVPEPPEPQRGFWSRLLGR